MIIVLDVAVLIGFLKLVQSAGFVAIFIAIPQGIGMFKVSSMLMLAMI
jgi:hypothetical protein